MLESSLGSISLAHINYTRTHTNPLLSLSSQGAGVSQLAGQDDVDLWTVEGACVQIWCCKNRRANQKSWVLIIGKYVLQEKDTGHFDPQERLATIKA